MPQREQGQGFVQADFFDNSGGLNLTDSPFRVKDDQATGNSYNYDYLATGGLQKRMGHTLLSATPDAQLRALGYWLYNTPASVKTLLRAASTKLQTVNQTTGACTNITDDTASPSSSFFSSNQPVAFSQFNTATVSAAWVAGGGLTNLLGYNGNKATTNGVPVAAGTVGATVGGASGVWPSTGVRWYAVVLNKASTGAQGNATLDVSATIAVVTDAVTLDLTTITAFDQTKYDQILIYRSATAGVSGFTTGDLIAQLPSSTTSYTDNGLFISGAVNVPRAGNTILDQSQLPAGTYNTITTWKRRLVTASGSTLYISDLNKPESWPLTNSIQVPSGGNITALAVISFNTPTTTSTDEFLVVFKEKEVWIVTGNTYADVSLKFIDYSGCVAQNLAVWANGFLCFMDYRGIYIWDGSSKPIYCSRPIEFAFGVNGDLDKSNMSLGWGTFFRKQNQVIWTISSSSLGINKIMVKLDVRLTLPQVASTLNSPVLEGVFAFDSVGTAFYAGMSTLPNTDETFYAGDLAGNTWKLYDNGNSDNGSGINFQYTTKTQDFASILTTKRFKQVIVWCRDSTTSLLTLNYWTSYRTDTGSSSSQAVQISNAVSNAIWDQASWDAAYWDTNLITYTPVVFNLNSVIGAEGDALTIQLVQADINSPVIIAGFSVIYSELGIRKST